MKLITLPINNRVFMIAMLLSFLSIASAHAGIMDDVNTNLNVSIGAMTKRLQESAITLLGGFLTVQILLSNVKQLFGDGDITRALGKTTAIVAWGGVYLWLVKHGSASMERVTKSIFHIAQNVTGLGGFSAEYIIDHTVFSATNLISAVNDASSMLNPFPLMLAGLVALIILAMGTLIAFKVFMIKIEAALVIMLSPISFALLGLDALKDQGIAPLKSLISLLYRIVLLAVIVSCVDVTMDGITAAIKGIDPESKTEIWTPLFTSVVSFCLLAFLAFKSDSIASNLASGSTNLGTADVASAAAMGAALGSAVVGAAGAAGKGAGTIGQMMKSMENNGAGAVSNASPVGTGGTNPVGPAPQKPSASLKSGDDNKPPTRPISSPSTTSNSPGANSSTAPNRGTSSAGIGSGNETGMTTDQKLDKLLEAGQAMPQSQKPSIGDHLSRLNDHVARESASTQVHVNLHAGD